MISIIDYKAGNAPSVYNALRSLDIDCKLIRQKSELDDAQSIILPGVGSASETMKSLYELNYVDLLTDKVLHHKVPFLGICVGLQILFDYSEEGDVECLGWIPGNVKKFSSHVVRVPQMGWNQVSFAKSSPLIQNIPDHSYLYFVNSYFAAPEIDSHSLGITDYGVHFTSMISHKNVYATQFHVEKSGKVGLEILQNFTNLAR